MNRVALSAAIAACALSVSVGDWWLALGGALLGLGEARGGLGVRAD